MSLPLLAVGVALGAKALSKGLGSKYPHTMYNCNTGQAVEVETKAQHDDYVKGGWVKSFDKCPLDTPFGRDYGEYDYADSVDDLADVQTKYDVVYQDDADLEGVAVYRVMALTYDPQRERRGYYRVKNYVIGSTTLNSQGRPTSFNYKGDAIRTFSTLDDAIAFYKSIGKQKPQPEESEPSEPSEPLPPPAKEPEGDDEPTTPPPTPVNPNPPMPPMGGFGGGGLPSTTFGYGGGF